MNTLFGATLQKSGDDIAWEVGGVASSFHKDLDGDAIAPEAIQRAIPAFMANRGPGGIKGGPIRLHHNFWDGLLKRAISLLGLDPQSQMSLVTSVALPLGRVTDIWVDDEGTTHWRGVLSRANPIARTIWEMLKEGAVHLGVSVGGKILGTRPGRDRLGSPCTLITDVRLDELSITDNPALRLTQGESPENGAYISAFAKTLQKSLGMTSNSSVAESAKTERWLQKAIGSTYGAELRPAAGLAASGGEVRTGMSRNLGLKVEARSRGTGRIGMDENQLKTGMGDQQPKAKRIPGTAKEPPTDVFGMTVSELTRELSKTCHMDRAELGDRELHKFLTDSAYGLAGITEEPPPALVNFVRYLQHFSNFCQMLPHMDDYQAAGTVEAMGPELSKALSDFEEGITDELKGSALRPPGSPGVAMPTIAFPTQYVCQV